MVFFGNERLVSGLEKTDAPILNGLIENGYEVVAVVSNYANSKSRNQRELEVAEIANLHNIPIFLPERPSEIIDELHSLNADIAVLVAYGRIVSQKIIDLFPKGIVNIHPSMLPTYRGPTPIESAILNGDEVTGVSIMRLSAGMDEGPVYAQRPIHLNGTETKFDLYNNVITTVTPLFFEIFPKIIDGSLLPQPQDNNTASYCKLIQKSDALLDWSKSAKQLEREIRAYLHWPQSRTKLGAVDVIITKAHAKDGNAIPGAIATENSSLLVGTGDGILAIESLKPLGKKEMPVSAFLAGYRSQLSG